MSARINTLVLICVAVAAFILTFQQVKSGPVAANDDSNDDSISWLMGNECKEDEYQAVGLLPECEPTCENKKPICTKIFYIMDSVQCFCKAPLVRDKKTNKCIQPSECPTTTTTTSKN